MTRIALVTGATSGIGRAIAARFAADRAEVFITGRHADTVERTAKELGVHGVVCDATDPSQVEALSRRLSSLDVLVNAAGGLAGAGSPGERSPLEVVAAEWQANLAQNLLGAVLTTTAVRDLLAPGSSVISIGSIGAERRGGSYGAAKAALAAWNAALSAELGPHGITTNVISAGYIAGTDFFQGGLTDERRDALVQETHNKRPGHVDDITQTAYFLASPGARHITGQTIHVNGGAHTTR
ncbi:SDR family oxidoreductase [Streptomyces sp. NA02950]|uniref:SDR family NAD(P)-dependent oxidoreductase n=1 Tax=Streptomyces sp. NA02950 TaxID=2742137 RepID=UPI0015901111|nr:SDR family oxidoreductase [Streptomyces sp. NA02950]QKV93814.1 SDR family oxidoreductase [Streptomyces sp. NA02950]